MKISFNTNHSSFIPPKKRPKIFAVYVLPNDDMTITCINRRLSEALIEARYKVTEGLYKMAIFLQVNFKDEEYRVIYKLFPTMDLSFDETLPFSDLPGDILGPILEIGRIIGEVD